MDGAHDMGGMHGFGPVVVEGGDEVFHEAWELRRPDLGRASSTTHLSDQLFHERAPPRVVVAH
jgi:hypothetical protein